MNHGAQKMERELKNLLKLSRPLEVGKTSTYLHNFINLSSFVTLITVFLLLCFYSQESLFLLIFSPVLFGLLFLVFLSW